MKSTGNFRKMMLAATFFVVLPVAWPALAAIPRAQVTPVRILNGEGVAMGGSSGQSLSLMDFRRSSSKKNNQERFVLDFGGADLKEAKGLVGYYHVELQDNPARLILELPQTFASRLSEKDILKRLQDSRYVRQALVQFDRNLQSLTLVFQLKQPVQIRVARVANPESTGKLVIDLLPENKMAKRRELMQQKQARLRQKNKANVNSSASVPRASGLAKAPAKDSRPRAPSAGALDKTKRTAVAPHSPTKTPAKTSR